MDMPRARTQAGNAVCAATASELATEIQAMPSTTMPGIANHTSCTATIRQDSSAWPMTPERTNSSRSKRARQRGKYSAATMAPIPRQDNIRVKVAGPPPCSSRATSGSRAESPALCRKNRKMRSSTAFSRCDCTAKFKPTRMAPRKRSPGSVLVRGSERQRRINTKEATASSAFSANTAAGLAAAIRPPASMGPTTRDRFMDTPFNASADGS